MSFERIQIQIILYKKDDITVVSKFLCLVEIIIPLLKNIIHLYKQIIMLL